MNFTYNATLDVMDRPIIGFPNQSELVHRLMVLLKCYIVAALENAEDDFVMIHKLRNYLVNFYMTFSFVMIALSAELIWKALPLMIFCYACQILKFYSFDTDARACLSYIGFVFCCLEFTGFEFVYDSYIILFFLLNSLYSLIQVHGHNRRKRSGLERASMLLIFIVETAVFLRSDIIDYRLTMLINAILSAYESSYYDSTYTLTIVFFVMSQVLLGDYWLQWDLDGHFGLVFQYLRNFTSEFILQFRRGV